MTHDLDQRKLPMRLTHENYPRVWPTKITSEFDQQQYPRHSHMKRKDSLEGSLNQVLFAAELEFLKILVPRLPYPTSNVNIECAGKSE